MAILLIKRLCIDGFEIHRRKSSQSKRSKRICKVNRIVLRKKKKRTIKKSVTKGNVVFYLPYLCFLEGDTATCAGVCVVGAGVSVYVFV